MFAESFKLILLAFAFELSFRLEQCDGMGLFEGLIWVDSITDFRKLYFTHWAGFDVIKVCLVNMAQRYNFWVILLIDDWGS